MPLATLGLFTFELKTAPFAAYDRKTAQRWPEQNRVGKPPALQHTGAADDDMTLTGAIVPELTGNRAKTLDVLRDMAGKGKAWSLIDGEGINRGRWVITEVSERGGAFTSIGQPRKMDFTLSLKRYWDDNPEAFGDLKDSQP
jgi:uncharacterized protein